MASKSPTLEGFRTMFRRPSLGFAEVAWHWSFGAAVLALTAFCFIEYLDSLPVSSSDLLLLQSSRRSLIARAITDILHGSGPRLAESAVLVACALSLVWIVLASFGRGIITRDLLIGSRENQRAIPQPEFAFRFRSLAGINFLRVTVSISAAVGSIVPWFFSRSRSSAEEHSVAGAFLAFVLVIVLVWFAWYLLNWILSLAALFVVAENRDTFGAIRAAVAFSSNRRGPVLAVNTWFDLAHITVLSIAVSAIAFPLSLLSVLPPGYGLIGAMLVMLAYFLVVDFLRVGRLAAYVAILHSSELGVIASVLPSNPNSGSDQSDAIDRNELILSDIPAPA